MARRSVVGVGDYRGPAGGWGALKAVAEARSRSRWRCRPTRAAALLAHEPADGFDCPGCAWPDPKHTSTFEFCENGAKAVTWEATASASTPEFFAAHTVTELLGMVRSRTGERRAA